jgi:5-methylcytosine-specific restriction endonuclease McrA
MPKVKCKLCKTSLERDEAYRTSLQSFCSIDHYKEYFSTLQKKSKPSVDNEWLKIRKIIIKLDGGRCRVCGTRYNLHVHHIKYRGEPGGTDDEGNLITLCLAHHELVHTDKKKYQPRCLAIVEKRKLGDALSRIKIGD